MNYESVTKTASGPGGKNGIYVPSLHRYFVGVPRHEESETEVLVYDIR